MEKVSPDPSPLGKAVLSASMNYLPQDVGIVSSSEDLFALRDAYLDNEGSTNGDAPATLARYNAITREVNKENSVGVYGDDGITINYDGCAITGAPSAKNSHILPQGNAFSAGLETWAIAQNIFPEDDVELAQQKKQVINMVPLFGDLASGMEPNIRTAVLTATRECFIQVIKMAICVLNSVERDLTTSFFGFNIMNLLEHWPNTLNDYTNIKMFDYQVFIFNQNKVHDLTTRRIRDGRESITVHMAVRPVTSYPVAFEPAVPTTRLALHIFMVTLLSWRCMHVIDKERRDQQVHGRQNGQRLHHPWNALGVEVSNLASFLLRLVDSDTAYGYRHIENRPDEIQLPPPVDNPNRTHRFLRDHIRHEDGSFYRVGPNPIGNLSRRGWAIRRRMAMPSDDVRARLQADYQSFSTHQEDVLNSSPPSSKILDNPITPSKETAYQLRNNKASTSPQSVLDASPASSKKSDGSSNTFSTVMGENSTESERYSLGGSEPLPIPAFVVAEVEDTPPMEQLHDTAQVKQRMAAAEEGLRQHRVFMLSEAYENVKAYADDGSFQWVKTITKESLFKVRSAIDPTREAKLFALEETLRRGKERLAQIEYNQKLTGFIGYLRKRKIDIEDQMSGGECS